MSRDLTSQPLTSLSLASSYAIDCLSGRFRTCKASILTTELSKPHSTALQTDRSASAAGGKRLPRKIFAPAYRKVSAHSPLTTSTLPRASTSAFGKLSGSSRPLSRSMFHPVTRVRPGSPTCLRVPRSKGHTRKPFLIPLLGILEILSDGPDRSDAGLKQPRFRSHHPSSSRAGQRQRPTKRPKRTWTLSSARARRAGSTLYTQSFRKISTVHCLQDTNLSAWFQAMTTTKEKSSNAY